MNINGSEILVIAVVFFMVFGPKELPKIGAILGRAVREFRRATDEITSQFTLEEREKTKDKG